LLCGYVGSKFLPVFGQHSGELDPIPNLRVAGDNKTHCQQSSVNLETHFEGGPDGEWEHSLDVTTDFAEVRGCAAHRNITARRKQLYGDFHFDALAGSALWLVLAG
jgi:hypothetical protein